MIEVHGITPFVRVPEINEGIAFYEGLGFDCTFRLDSPGYAYMRCKGGGIRLLEQPEVADQIDTFDPLIYIDVADVDALFAEVKPFLDTLPADRWKAPHDREYGLREFHAWDPAGTWVLFGKPIEGA